MNGNDDIYKVRTVMSVEIESSVSVWSENSCTYYPILPPERLLPKEVQ